MIRRAAVGVGLLRGKVAHVGLAPLDQFDRVAVDMLEVIAGEERLGVGSRSYGGEVEVRFAVDRAGDGRGALGFEAKAMVGPALDQPADVAGDGLHVLRVLLDRVGVVETQVADAVVLARDTEIEADGLGMAEVQVAVGLGREPRDDPRMAFLGDVAGDDVADEVARGG